MFYSHNILQKRGGRFGKIWIAATKSSTLTKREYVTINIVNTCEDIVKCIVLQEEPRLSLYLSSQLMCGVVRVYKKQCEYLANEVINFHSRLSSGRLSITVGIDLPISREKHTLPEISMLDPQFGMVQLSSVVPPFMIPEEDMVIPTPPSSLNDRHRVHSPRSSKKLKMDVPQHLVSNPEVIKLKESQTPMIQNIQIPGGEIDLASFDPGFETALTRIQAAMDLLHAPPMVVDEITNIPEEEKEIDGLLLLEEETGQLVLSPIHQRKTRKHPKRKPEAEEMASPVPELIPPDEILLSPKFPTIEELTAPAIDINLPELTASQDVLLPPEIPSLEELTAPSTTLSPKFTLEELTVPAVGDIIPPDVTTSPHEITPQADKITIPNLELSPIEANPQARRRGKKRCLFIDRDIQLQKETMRQNMATSKKLCKTSNVMPLQTQPSTADLFKLPTRIGTRKSEQLMDIWRRHAVPCDYESPSEAGHPIWSIYYLRDGSAPTDEDALDVNRELSEMEGMRDAMTDSISKHATPASLLLTDSTRLSESTRDSIHINPDSIRLGRRLTTESIDEVPIELEMQDQRVEFDPIKEEDREVMDEHTVRASIGGEVTLDMLRDEEEKADAERLNVSQETVLRQISNMTLDGSMTFLDLCPPGSYKQVVVNVFTVCIELNVMGIINMSQTAFYGSILIERGPKF